MGKALYEYVGKMEQEPKKALKKWNHSYCGGKPHVYTWNTLMYVLGLYYYMHVHTRKWAEKHSNCPRIRWIVRCLLVSQKSEKMTQKEYHGWRTKKNFAQQNFLWSTIFKICTYPIFKNCTSMCRPIFRNWSITLLRILLSHYNNESSKDKPTN